MKSKKYAVIKETHKQGKVKILGYIIAKNWEEAFELGIRKYKLTNEEYNIVPANYIRYAK